MKKIVAILLCIAMLLVGTPVALAADNAVIKVHDVKASPGDTVSVTISLENNPGITGARIFVNYNSEVLKLKNVENGVIFSGTAPVLSPTYDVVPYQLQWSIGVKDMTDSGTLATLTFDVNENAGDGTYDIRLTYDQEDIFNTKFKNVNFEVVNGTVEISSGPTSLDDFSYEIKDGGIVITGYKGTSSSIKLGAEYEVDGAAYKVIGIAESAFEGNETIKSIEIPETVKYIGDYAFYDCTSLIKVTVFGKNTELGEKSLGYYMINRKLDGITEGFTIYGYAGSTAEAYAGSEDEITFVSLSEECTHEYVEDVVAPTCLEDGYTKHVCKLCGALYIDSPVGKLGHSFTNYVSDRNATCEKDGTKTAKCDRCDATKTVDDIGSKLGHMYGEWKHVEGTKTHTRVCANDPLHTESTNCTFTSKVSKEPGCTENGTRTFTCSACGYSYDETIAPAGHKDVDNNGICDICKENICDHENVKHVEAVKATCASIGNIEHYHCEKCGLYAKDAGFKELISESETTTAIDPANHSGKTEIRNVKEASCEEAGYTGDTYCLACGAKIASGKKTDKLGHSFTNYVSDRNATCEKDGTKTAKCDRCDATKTVDDIGSKLSHTIAIDNAVPPTCSSFGLTEGKHCSSCGKIIVAQTRIDKLPHSFAEIEKVEATCTNDGYTIRECAECGEQERVDIVKAIGHIDADNDGICDVCGSTIVVYDSVRSFLDLIYKFIMLILEFLIELKTA